MKTLIESIKRRATKFILKSVEEYLISIRELHSLEDREFIAGAVFCYKVNNNHTHQTLESRIWFSRDVDRGYALRSMDILNLLTSHYRTNLFKCSLMRRIAGDWNSLPLNIREASSVADFKFKVQTLLTHLISVYIVVIFCI